MPIFTVRFGAWQFPWPSLFSLFRIIIIRQFDVNACWPSYKHVLIIALDVLNPYIIYIHIYIYMGLYAKLFIKDSSYVMLGLWNLFLMRLGLCFQGFLALLGFLIMILKTLMFNMWIFIHRIKRCFWSKKTMKMSKTVAGKF